MHSDLHILFSQATQAEIARTTAQRSTLVELISSAISWTPRPARTASAGGGMLHLWRHGSPAHGS